MRNRNDQNQVALKCERCFSIALLRTMAIAALLLALSGASAVSSPLAYVIGNDDSAGTSHFGTVDLATGMFSQVGPNAPVGSEGLAVGPNGHLLTIAYNSDLYSINPATGAYSLVGPTGLGDCTTPDSPCGSTSSLTLGSANGTIYATDFANRLYAVDPLTGSAKLIGATGIPAIPFVPAALNPDGTINFYEEALFGGDGKLYATFDAVVFDLATSSAVSIAVPPFLYEIDPSTGAATAIGPTELSIGAVASANGTPYAFNLLQGEITELDLANGNSTSLIPTDPSAGTIRGAAAVTPEPLTIALTGFGMTLLLAEPFIAGLRKMMSWVRNSHRAS